jgi:tetratricopeptide (TPR) repeat protein
MNRQWRRVIFGLLGVAFLASTSLASAQTLVRELIKRKEYTEGEWALLPEWCVDSQDGPYGSPEGPTGLNRSPRAAKWVGLMGTDFWAMHHYCRGLRDLQRLNRADLSSHERLYLQGRAVDEFNYIFRNTKPSMPLQPEVYLRQGEVFVMMNDLTSASVAFENARTLLPSYWPAYARWIDVLIRLRQFDQARKLTEEGLAHAPGNAELTKLQRQLAAAPRGNGKAGAVPQAQSKPAAAAKEGEATAAASPVTR